MRPLALAFALAAPLAAAALETPTTGKILFDGTSTEASYINIATCSGVANDVRSTDDKMTVDITWALTLGDGVTWAVGGTYFLYVTNQPPDTSGNDALSCTASTSSSTFKYAAVGDNAGEITPTRDANPMISAISPTRQSIAAAHAAAQTTATAECSTSLPTIVYLCVQWLDASGTVNGRATGTMTLDVTAPTGAPTNVTAGAGDGRLHVSWTGVSGADRYRALAVPQGGSTIFRSGEDSSTSTTIDSLSNGTTYDVSVYALDAAGNPGPAGTATGMPQPVDDFWEHYKGAGGRETGGCSTGAAGVLALLAAAAGLRITRRRKP